MESSSQIKKSKKKKQESDIESVVCLNDHPKKKKKMKAPKQESEIEIKNNNDGMEQTRISSPTKNEIKGTHFESNTSPVKTPKKRRQDSDIESIDCVNELQKKKKKSKSQKENLEEAMQNDEAELDANHEMSTPTKCSEDCSWSNKEYSELLRRIESQLPDNDTASFDTRIEKLNWDEIKFGNHSVNDCYEAWKRMRSNVRHFRLLVEVVQDLKAWVENPWKSFNKKKKSRHPEQPSRPLSSFMLFYMDKKNKITKRNPGLKLTEISRLIGEKYNNLSDAKRSFYIEKAKLMQEEYRQNLSKFHEKYPELMNMHKASRKGLSRKLKKPLSPIRLYIQDKLEKHKDDEDFNKLHLTEKYKNMWKNSLSNKKKAYWISIAKEEEEKYLDLLREEEDGDVRPSHKSVISKEELAILDRLAGKPEKPPNSAYSLFSKLMLQDKDQNHVEGLPKNRMKEIAIKWKQLPDEKKQVYAERVQHLHETYKLEMANYLETLPEDKKAEELEKLQTKKRRITRKSKSNPDAQSNGLFRHEPPKPPATAWDLYKSEYARKNPSLPAKLATKHAADLWKSLPPKQTEKYNQKFAMLKEKYLVDFEDFLKSLNEEELKDYSLWKSAQQAEEGAEEESGDDESLSEQDVEDGSASSSSSDDDSGVSDK